MNSKYLEMENKLLQAERVNKSLLSQLDIEKSKNKKLLSDFEQMVNMVKEAQAEKKSLSEKINTKKCDCEVQSQQDADILRKPGYPEVVDRRVGVNGISPSGFKEL